VEIHERSNREMLKCHYLIISGGNAMLLGGTVTGDYTTPEEWGVLLRKSGFKAITAPFSCLDNEETTDRYMSIIRDANVVISEIGVWKNLFDPDPSKADEALLFAKGQIRLADKLKIPCCVNIAGTSSPLGWDAADKNNFSDATRHRIIEIIREIIDEVRPEYSYYCLEPMPWMLPDSPDEYIKLIEEIDREKFAVHMDFVNMINSPRRFLMSEDFIEECFSKLAPYIKSTHIKDSRMDKLGYTTHIDECPPGKGELDYAAVLKIMDRYLPSDGAILLEHMNTFEEYDEAFRYVKEMAIKAQVEV